MAKRVVLSIGTSPSALPATSSGLRPSASRCAPACRCRRRSAARRPWCGRCRVAVLECRRRADHSLTGNAVHLLRDRADEVASASRADVGREVAGLEEGKQLAHRPVADLGVGEAERRVGRRREELPHGLLERPDRDSFVGLAEALDQIRHVAGQARQPRPAVFRECLGCSLALAGSASAIALQRRKTKSAWTYWGFSHHSVPSLSNVATRSAGGTKDAPGTVTDVTNSRIAVF